MRKTKLYRYVGRNGIVTTPVLLDDIKHYVYYILIVIVLMLILSFFDVFTKNKK